MIRIKTFLILSLHCSILYVCGQEPKLDSLTKMTYKQLVDSFYETEDNPSVAIKYANSYLERSKKDFDSVRILDGYYFMACVSKRIDAIKYSDSIIDFALETKINNPNYPYLGYFIRADELYEARRFKESLNDYLEAQKHVKNNLDNNSDNVFINFRIALLKSRLGHYDEALQIFKEVSKEYSTEKNRTENPKLYLTGLFGLSDGYLRANKLDSSSFVNKLGIKEAVNIDNKLFVQYFRLNEGINHYKRKRYEASIDSLNMVIPALKMDIDLPNLSEAYYYIGKSNYLIGNKDVAAQYFIKVDSIFNIIGDLHPDLRDTYEILISYQVGKKDKSTHLKYLTQLIKVDSVISSNYQYLSQKIYKEFDTPKLISEKNMLIDDLKSKETNFSKVTYVMVSVLLLILVVLTYQVRTKLKYRSNYLMLVKKLENSNLIKEVNSDQDTKSKVLDIGVPDTIVKSILDHLEEFENSKLFVDSSITLNSLSQDFKSNSTYVSKVINHVKGRSLSDYLNHLRISNATIRLSNDTNFRKYTIKAIAAESGFKSAETFSKKFYDFHGIYPSYFIKQLEKNE